MSVPPPSLRSLSFAHSLSFPSLCFALIAAADCECPAHKCWILFLSSVGLPHTLSIRSQWLQSCTFSMPLCFFSLNAYYSLPFASCKRYPDLSLTLHSSSFLWAMEPGKEEEGRRWGKSGVNNSAHMRAAYVSIYGR